MSVTVPTGWGLEPCQMWLKPPGPPLATLIMEEEGFFLGI